MADVSGSVQTTSIDGTISQTTVSGATSQSTISGTATITEISGAVSQITLTGVVTGGIVLNPDDFVPYTGATGSVDLGVFNLATTGTIRAVNFNAINAYKFNGNHVLFTKALNNLFVGDCGNTSVSGIRNFFAGDDAGSNITSGGQNVCVGVAAGQLIETGNNNMLLGMSAGQGLTDGDDNVGVGHLAIQLAGTTNKNVGIGTRAGSINSGSGNVFIGDRTGSASTGQNNKLFIDNSNTTLPLIYGEFDNDYLRLNGTTYTSSALITNKITGGTTASARLTLKSTDHATKGAIFIEGDDIVQYGGLGGDKTAAITSIAYDITNSLQTMTSNKWKINGDSIVIGKGTGDCTGDNSIFLGKFWTNANDDSLEIGWNTNHATFHCDNTGVYIGNTGSIMSSLMGHDVFRVYGINTKFENTNFYLEPSTGSAITVYERAYGAGSNWRFQRANGTKASPTSVGNGTILSRLHWQGYHSDGAIYYDAAQMYVRISKPIGASAEMPAKFILGTTKDGETSITECWVVDENQNFGFGFGNDDTPEERVHINGNIVIGTGTTGIDYFLKFKGENSTGTITFMEDENRFKFDNGIYSSGTSTFGDGGTTNYTEIKPDGEINLHGTAKVKRFLLFEGKELETGSSPPTLGTLGNYNYFLYTINDGSVIDFHVPTDWKVGTDFIIHIAWGINETYATANGEVQWRADWSAIPHDGTEQIDNPTHSGQVDSGDINIPATAKTLIETNITIPGTNIVADDKVGFTLSRIAIDDGNNPTAEPGIVCLAVYYTANKLGEAT